MKLKMRTLVMCESALRTLGNTKGLSSITAYRISKNIKAILEEIKTYNDTYTKICEEYVDKDKDGKPIIKDNKYSMPLEKEIEVNKQLNQLLDEDVDIQIKKVTLADINKAGLSPLELDSIEFMLDFEEEK